jgi:16S rRNA (adenine1518-N6/adenine1519-N6)-dimethyltransferase
VSGEAITAGPAETRAAAPAAAPTAQDPDPLHESRLGAEVVRRYLRAHHLAARRSLSQNHLVDGDVISAIVDSAQPLAGRHVLEIGPGLGVLTGALLRAGARVTAVELDARLASHLRERFAPALEREDAGDGPSGGLRLVEADFLDLRLDDEIRPPYDVVANLPYHVTSPVLHRLLGGAARPDRFVVMLQREVAERIAARPGGMSYLSVFVQYHAQVRVVHRVPASAFEPVPDVDSAVVAGVVAARRLQPHDEDGLWRLVQAGFRERRKMIRNVLPRQLPGVERARFEEAFTAVGIAPDARPQVLSVDDWIGLARTLEFVGDER